MKKTNTLLASFLFAIVLGLFTYLLFDIGSSPIVGRWFDGTGNSSDYVEMFDDGTFSTSDLSISGTYSTSGDKIRLSVPGVQDDTFTYEIKGDSMFFYDDGGNIICKFIKQ